MQSNEVAIVDSVDFARLSFLAHHSLSSCLQIPTPHFSFPNKALISVPEPGPVYSVSLSDSDSDYSLFVS